MAKCVVAISERIPKLTSRDDKKFLWKFVVSMHVELNKVLVMFECHKLIFTT